MKTTATPTDTGQHISEVDDLASRVRVALSPHQPSEVRMFGGTAFMIDGKMVASASKRGLLLRVGKEGQGAALQSAGAKRVEMGKGRPMSGYVRIAEADLTDGELKKWLDVALTVVRALPKRKSARGRS